MVTRSEMDLPHRIWDRWVEYRDGTFFDWRHGIRTRDPFAVTESPVLATFFNPFDETVMKPCVERLRAHPWSTVVAYFKPVHCALFADWRLMAEGSNGMATLWTIDR